MFKNIYLTVLLTQAMLYGIIVPVLAGELDEALDEYELLDRSMFTHRIVKRSTSTMRIESRQVNFFALGREFRLFLQRKPVTNKFKIFAMNGPNDEKQELDLDIHVYHGYDLGDPEHSSVHAVWEDDKSLTAMITTRNDTYAIEPSWRFNQSSHSMLAYRRSKVKMLNDLGPAYCGFVNPDGQDDATYLSDHAREEYTESPGHRIRRQANNEDTLGTPAFLRSQQTSSKDTCQLLLVADYRFFETMGQSSYQKTSSYLIGLIDRVDTIYRSTHFNDYTGLGFEIKEIRIYERPTPVEGTDKHYNQEQSAPWDTRELLEVFSRDPSYKGFCLAHLFTHQSFSGGVLGLAYIGSPRSYSVGGVCSPVYYKGGHALYLNTGWSSSLNHYERRLLTQEADLVTTHEFGHNWGSEHDPDTSECSPKASIGGKFIMYTYSVSGYDANNKIFSPCSQRSIGAVLKTKKDSCFKERRSEFCGNSHVEGDEECDGGPDTKNGDDPCCDTECRLKYDSNGHKYPCSDKNSLCCESCQLAASNKTCHQESLDDTSCEGETHCTGTSAICPEPVHKADETLCLERGVCRNGECIPFCERFDMVSCICDNVEDSCYWCCKSGFNSTCEPFAAPDEDTAQELPDGMPCVYGYCEEGECQKQVQDLVQRLWDIIENITGDSLVAFMRANIVGTVIVLSLVLWIPASCAISYVDRKRRAREELEVEWLHKDNPNLTLDKSYPDTNKGTLNRRFKGASIRQAQVPIIVAGNPRGATYI